jgi:cell division protein FtsQ
MPRRPSPEAAAPRSLRTTVRYGLITLGIAALMIFLISVFHGVERFLIANPRFTLRAPESRSTLSSGIRVEGLVHASRARVRDAFAEDFGRSVYLLPLAERRLNLLAIDWVKNASVSRVWPNRVEVRIIERVPVAFVQLTAGSPGHPSRIALIDEDGVILDAPRRSSYKLPVLTGIQLEQSEAMRRSRVHRMLQLLHEVGPLGKEISEIDVSDPDNLKTTMQMGDKALVLILGRENYLSRLQTFFKHYSEIRKRVPNATTLDLRLDDRITVKNGVENGG